VDDESVRGKLLRLSEDLYPTVQVSDKVQYVPRPVRPRAVQEEPRESLQSWQRLLPSPLVSITQDEDGLSHIQLANGTRYYEGAVLRPGVVLAHIGADRVTVRGGTEPLP
jgi:type III secretion protein D